MRNLVLWAVIRFAWRLHRDGMPLRRALRFSYALNTSIIRPGEL